MPSAFATPQPARFAEMRPWREPSTGLRADGDDVASMLRIAGPLANDEMMTLVRGAEARRHARVVSTTA